MIESPDQYVILVSGATGRQGGAVTRHLVERGFRVRALTRHGDQDSARRLASQGVEIVEGHFDDRASLERALNGVYGAYSVQNFHEEGIEAEIRWGKAFADAARDAGVGHFVYSSVGGADRNTGIPHFDSKWQIEEHIRSLGLPATILRPAYFMDNWERSKQTILDGKIHQPLSPGTSLQQIAVDDIGALAAVAFADGEHWKGESVEIAGDELTMREIAEVFSRVLGRAVEYVQMPWETFEAQASPESVAMMHWFESVGYAADIDALRRIYPQLVRLDSFFRAQKWTLT